MHILRYFFGPKISFYINNLIIDPEIVKHFAKINVIVPLNIFVQKRIVRFNKGRSTYRLAQILTPGNTININSNSNNYV